MKYKKALGDNMKISSLLSSTAMWKVSSLMWCTLKGLGSSPEEHCIMNSWVLNDFSPLRS